jgi:hypothetical protein
MRREIYGDIVVSPIRFPDELELRVYPLSRKDDRPLVANIPINDHHSWEWVRGRFPGARLDEVEGLLKAGKAAILLRGVHPVDLPEDAVIGSED